MEESKGVCALSKYEKHYLLHRDSRARCWELAFISILSSFQNSFSTIFFSYFQFVKIIYLNSKCFSLAAAHCDRNSFLKIPTCNYVRHCNVCFIKNRTKHSSNTLVSLLRIFMKQTLCSNIAKIRG